MKRKRAAAAAMIVLLAGMTAYGIHSLREWIETDQNEGKAILEEELDSSGGDGNTSSENGEPYANEAAEDGETEDQWEKGYDLPVDSEEREEAEADCGKMLEKVLSADPEIARSGTVLTGEKAVGITENMAESGDPIAGFDIYYNMKNYEKMDRFLQDCGKGREHDLTGRRAQPS